MPEQNDVESDSVTPEKSWAETGEVFVVVPPIARAPLLESVANELICNAIKSAFHINRSVFHHHHHSVDRMLGLANTEAGEPLERWGKNWSELRDDFRWTESVKRYTVGCSGYSIFCEGGLERRQYGPGWLELVEASDKKLLISSWITACLCLDNQCV